MKLTKCENGHFYDADRYPQCPYCNPDLQNEDGFIAENKSTGTENAAFGAESAAAAGSFSGPVGAVAGWLVVMTGAARGTDYRITEGRNYFGVNADGAPVPVSPDAPLSVRQLVLTYEPEKNVFLLQPGTGTMLSKLNGETVLTVTNIRNGDEIALGDGLLQFVSFCGPFRWERE